MTAEIAILNKMAVALAADSAVSIGRPPNLKIYNTVNKIFELSGSEPIGIMVYGRLDFMGIPYEPLIKEYRRIIGCNSRDYVQNYADDFRDHLCDLTYSDDEAKKNVAICLSEHFGEIAERIESEIVRYIRDRGAFHKSKINGIAQKILRSEIAKFKKLPFSEGFSRVKVPDEYLGVVESIVKNQFAHHYPTKLTNDLLFTLAGYLLAKETLSINRTGIVIAGFGRSEMFPTLIAFETDGIIDGKLKWKAVECVDIRRSGPDADILGFAQDDMIRSFLDGIDPYIRQYFESLMEGSIRSTADLIFNSITTSEDEKKAALAAFEATLQKMVADLSTEIDNKIRYSSSDPIRDMIRAMPKQELATLATSLVEVTSLKRKVSRMQETVGGEVDVAVISKSEGFVWIQRKHYFPSELNGRFMVRQSRSTEKES